VELGLIEFQSVFEPGAASLGLRICRYKRVVTSLRRKFPRALKVSAIRRLEAGDSVGEVARSYKIDTNALRRWRRDYERAPEAAFPGPGRRPSVSRISEMQRQIERHAQQIDYLKQRIRSVEEQRISQAKKCENDLSMEQHA